METAPESNVEGVSTHGGSRVAVYVTVLKVDGAIIDVHATALQQGRALAFLQAIHGGHGSGAERQALTYCGESRKG